MGQRISIDKHVSSLDDILEISSSYYSRVKFETQIPDSITQHLKIWKFTESTSETVRCSPVPLFSLPKHKFTLSSSECYLVIMIYRPSDKGDDSMKKDFPASLWKLMESTSNMTPRGLNSLVASNDQNVCLTPSTTLDSFLLSESSSKSNTTDKEGFKYTLYVWNGKSASPVVKAYALAKGYEFESYLQAGKEPLLQVLFSGGVIRNNKLQKGSVHALDDRTTVPAGDEERNTPSGRQLKDTKEQVQLLKWLLNNKFEEYERLEDSPKNDSSSCSAFFSKLKNIFFSSGNGSESDSWNLLPANDTERTAFSTNQISARPNLGLQLGGISSSASGAGAPRGGMNLNLGGLRNDDSNTGQVMRGGEEIDDYDGFEDDEDYDDNDEFDQPGYGRGTGNNGTDSRQGQTLGFGAQENPRGLGIGLNIGGLKMGAGLGGREERKDLPGFGNGGHTNRQGAQGVGGIGSLGLNKLGNGNSAAVPKMGIGSIQVAGLKTRHQDQLAFEFDPSNQNEVIGDVRDTTRKNAKLDYYSKICSEIIPGLLYVGSDLVARNYDELKSKGITHVVNCAGDRCLNYFPDKFTYLTYYLKDSKTENIECLFYEVIEFIESVKKQGGRTFIHCIQGVSRSVTMCLSYLMFKEKITFEEGCSRVRDLRGVSNPNMGFTVQLLQWYKRLYESYDQIKVTPRIFAIGSHQVEQADKVVARMLLEALYSPRNNLVLDRRGVFIIQAPSKTYIWLGDNINDKNRDTYVKCAHQHLKNLQAYEKASTNVATVECGREPIDFWRAWGHDRAPARSADFIQQWDMWYIQLGSSRILTPHSVESRGSNENREEKVVETKTRKLMYIYPDVDQPRKNLDIDELELNDFIIVCVDSSESCPEAKVYLWKVPEFEEESSISEEEFKSRTLQHFFGKSMSSRKIQYLEEEGENESDEFLDQF